MPVHSFVDLTGPVSLRDLQRLLEYLPEDADLDRDVRWSDVGTGVTRYLGLRVGVVSPLPPEK